MTSSEAAETQFPLTCRNSYCPGAFCPFFRDITYLIFDSERILLQSHRAYSLPGALGPWGYCGGIGWLVVTCS